MIQNNELKIKQNNYITDHVFLFVKNESTAFEMGRKLGFNENYRRRHIGQGTANICYCFENAFLELLWVEDENEIKSNAVLPTGLYERSLSHVFKSSPIGIAYRKNLLAVEAFEKWNFYPPYLNGGAISVAKDSTNVTNPFIFEALNSVAPKYWAPEKRNGLQEDSGYISIQFHIEHPIDIEVCKSLKALNESGDIDLEIGASNFWGLSVTVSDIRGRKLRKKIL